MSKERELLESFKEWYNKRYKSPILFDDIKSFLSSRPEEKEENSWKSIDDGMIVCDKTMIFRDNDGNIFPGSLDGDEMEVYDMEAGAYLLKHQIVTHWMPLPEFNPNNQ